MTRISNKSLFLTTALLMILAACFLTIPSRAENYSTSGSGRTGSTFFVESYGNAKVVFAQTEGLCHELSYTHLIDGIQGDEDEWGMYHIKVETPNGGVYTEDWAKTFNGGSYTLSLGGSGVYRITVTPFTGYEMTEAWTLDQFISWTRYPEWWISEQQNCRVITNVSANVYVQQVDQDTKAVLNSYTVTLSYGNNTVAARSAPSGYTQVSPSPVSVNVNQNGQASINTITFYYRKNTPSSATVSVYCYDENGSYLNLYYETVSSGKTIYPKSIGGYTATSGGVYVSFSNGTCNPSSITFYYRKNTVSPSQPSTQPGSSGTNGTPYSPDTRYNPGQTGSSRDLYALAVQKLATRTGPGTQYAEPGTFNVAGQWIRILAKAYDANGVCWVKCEIPTSRGTIIAWTGWKRFDHSTLDINAVPYGN